MALILTLRIRVDLLEFWSCMVCLDLGICMIWVEKFKKNRIIVIDDDICQLETTHYNWIVQIWFVIVQ